MSSPVDDLHGVELFEGERVDYLIDTAGERSSESGDALLLTNHRVIRMSRSARSRQIVMASIEDIGSVEISAIGQGFSAYLWAGLAVILSVILYTMIDHDVWKVVAALAVLSMGVYLIVNRLLDSGSPSVVVRAGETEIRWQFDAKNDSDQIHGFVKRLYQAKTTSGSNRVRRIALR